MAVKDALLTEYDHEVATTRKLLERVPALVITSEDDPFVPSEPFRNPKLTTNPCITLQLCRHGGHCGFVGLQSGEDDGYWAENQAVEFVEQRCRGY